MPAYRNPVFEKCLLELLEEARESDSPFSKIYELCLDSLRRYPLPLKTPAHCKILRGFGKTVVQRLQRKLESIDPFLDISISPIKRPKVSPDKLDDIIAILSDDENDKLLRHLAGRSSQRDRTEVSKPRNTSVNAALGNNESTVDDIDGSHVKIDSSSISIPKEDTASPIRIKGMSYPLLIDGTPAKIDSSPIPISEKSIITPSKIKGASSPSVINGSPVKIDSSPIPILEKDITTPTKIRDTELKAPFINCCSSIDESVQVTPPSNLDDSLRGRSSSFRPGNIKKNKINILKNYHELSDEDEDESSVFGSLVKPRGKGKKAENNDLSKGNVPLQESVSAVRKERNVSKEYVPRTRSGAYAILITLYKKSLEDDYRGFMTKAEIIKEAQPLSDESFVQAQPEKFNYTAWNGSSTLEKRGLIRKWDSPRKIDITKQGKDLAIRILEAELILEGKNNSFPSDSSIEISLSQPLDTRHESDGSDHHSLSQPVEVQSLKKTSYSDAFEEASWLDNNASELENIAITKAEKFLYCYVCDFRSGAETNDQNLADMDIDSHVSYLIRCRKGDLEKSGKRFHLKERMQDKENLALIYAFLHELDCDDFSPLSTSKELLSKSNSSKTEPEPVTNQRKKSKESETGNVTEKNSKKSIDQAVSKQKSKKFSELPINEIIVDSEEPIIVCDYRYWIKESLETGVLNGKKIKKASSPTRSEFTLEPGKFEIILLVDSAETQGGKTGGKKSRKEITIQELDANRVYYEKRNMNIGDFLWIAKEKVKIDTNSYWQLEPRELVLPFIVERKRMDDLRSSIIDNRYGEQKFRMGNCGIRNKYYLVEDFGKGGDRNFGKFGHYGDRGGAGSRGDLNLNQAALEQAIANTAVQEGFFVKRTRDQKESIAWITVMTRILKNRYEGLKLNSCVMDELVKDEIDFETNLLSYKELNENSRKNKNLCIREIFMKMLMQQKGLTLGMAWKITELYSTPIIIREAYLKKSEKDVEKMLQGLLYDPSKKIPLNVSKTLGILFTKSDLR